MAGETRIIAFDAGTSEGAELDLSEFAPLAPAGAETEPAPAAPEEAFEAPASRLPEWLVPALALLAIAGWSGFFAWARAADFTGTPIAEWPALVSQWAVPVLLVCVAWLLALRNSRREAMRFGATARMLSAESATLEARLSTVNRELSLAREFLASQSRDLDALGRVAADRLSTHAGRLQELVRDNGSRIDALADVSEAALENMEKLRGQLPVIASSAKDVTNNIGNAGRAAHAQLADLVSGFNRLNDFGQASERQVAALRTTIDEAIAEFSRQTDLFTTQAETRFAELGTQGAQLRDALDRQEADALAAIRNRARALVDELREARETLDSHEEQSLTSLRARLTAVRDEGGAIARSLRDGEARALEGWTQAVARLEASLAEAAAQVDSRHEDLARTTTARIAALADELDALDRRAAERAAHFAAAAGERRAEAEAFEEAALGQLSQRLDAIDHEVARRRDAQLRTSEALAAQAEALGTRLAEFEQRLAAAAAQGSETEQRIVASLRILGETLGSSRTALDGTGAEIAQLTDDSVRLLELLQASKVQTSEELPQWLGASEARLAAIEGRIAAMRETIDASGSMGERLERGVASSGENLRALLGEVEAAHEAIAARNAAHHQSLSTLQSLLADVAQRSEALSDRTRGQLAEALATLAGAADEAVTAIGEKGALAVADLARQIARESGSAVEQAMQAGVAEATGKLELAATRAAGVGRDAAIQLRDQLAKVAELVGNLEQRVSHARKRAREQVDNDFARRAALITEALNSNAIDIARAISADVSDTAWAAYLRGDRGIFTRRAVSLIESAEGRAIAQLYEGDRDFREHVSRYVHDFEAILRQVLSTRDGHALGVTLLSSDMGKLYVALAQGIERLRD